MAPLQLLVTRPAFVLACLCVQVFVIHLVGGLQFYYNGFSDTGNLTLWSKSTTPEPYRPSVSASNTLWLLPDPDMVYQGSISTATTNRVAYSNPIPFLYNNSQNVLSFNTSFSFKLVGGMFDGMAFFVAPTLEAPTDSDYDYLGLLPGTNSSGHKLLALEFDKYQTSYLKDPSNSHIGVDIGSLISSPPIIDSSFTTANPLYYPKFNLNMNNTFTVWMSFNGANQEIKVWMTDSKTVFPQSNPAYPPIGQLEPLITVSTNKLPSELFMPQMYVGFSGATGSVSRFGAAIYNWAFSVEDIPVPAPSNGSVAPSINTPRQSNSSQKLFTILLSVVGSLLLLASIVICVAVFIICRRKHKPRDANQKSDKSPDHLQNSINLVRYSYRQLKDSTQNFNEKTSLIQEGGYSKIFKGTLVDGTIVAVKKLKEGLRKETDFTSELKVISSIRHRNLLQLLGWSYEKGEALLVYKFMSNGSLDKYLFGERRGTLDSDKRLIILAGIAAALEYLHCRLGESILHRDVKASNVLLTDDFEAVVRDFGLARLIKHNEMVTATMVGTPGYMAPEVIMTGKVTEKADVYGFGVLMLEVASGTHAISRGLQGQHVYIVDWVKRLQQNESNYNIMQILDPTILSLSSNPTSQIESQWKHAIDLALSCCHPLPHQRPDMKYVSQCIQDIISLHSNAPSPHFNPIDQLAPSAPFKYRETMEEGSPHYYDYLSFFKKDTQASTSSSQIPSSKISS